MESHETEKNESWPRAAVHFLPQTDRKSLLNFSLQRSANLRKPLSQGFLTKSPPTSGPFSFGSIHSPGWFLQGQVGVRLSLCGLPSDCWVICTATNRNHLRLVLQDPNYVLFLVRESLSSWEAGDHRLGSLRGPSREPSPL